MLIVSIGATMLVPTASAATTRKTFAYVEATPNTVGVGDSITIYMWIDKVFPGADMQNDYRFHNFKLTITLPDGSTFVKTFDTISDTTSNQGYVYTPTMTGTYNVKFEFPETYVNATSHVNDATADDVYLASSDTETFNVQEASIGKLPDSYPLPMEYWSRPIYGENSFWYTISSNWLGNGAPGYGGFAASYNYGGNGELFPGDAVGSLTPHVMWTKELQSGGVVGGNNFKGYEGNTYFEGSAYLQRFVNPIIVNGRLYYTDATSYLAPSGGDSVCVNLRSGEEIWRRSDVPALSFALIFDPEDPNQHGVYNALLIASSGGGFFGGGTSWSAFDADTGKALFNATNIPSGRKAMGPNGECLIYTTSRQGTNYVVSQWNSSNLWTWTDTPSIATSVNAGTPARYDYVKPITYNGANLTTPFTVIEAYYKDCMLCYNGTLASTGASFFFGATISQAPYNYFLVNLNPDKGTVGAVTWMKTVTPSKECTVIEAGVDPVNRVFVENLRELNCFIGYDLNTGNQLWTTENYPQTAMDYYGSPASASLAANFAYGKMYSAAYAGIVYCYDTKTGALLWTYGNGGAGNSTDSGFSVPGNYPTFVAGYANGLIYTITSEHTIETPLFKGSLARALNATTGEEVWTLNSYTGEFMTTSYAIADGFNTWFNGLDNRIYTVGKGASQLTVTAPDAGLTPGQSVVIKGTVTDLSHGAEQEEVHERFSTGLPVASDLSMKDWMGYVYQQKPLPTNFTGVTVSVNVIDQNGNYRTIGTTTSDIYGNYKVVWTPDITGTYTVVAMFAGSNGYWPSTAEESFTVDQAAASTQAPEATHVPSMADQYFLPAVIGVILAIIIVGAVLALLVTKKP
jgi:outer membrane protein assembly factor BamB